MRIFYIEIDKFLKTHNKEFLMPYADIQTKTEKRFLEYAIGRYLVKSAAQKYYNVSDTKIITNQGGKPIFKNADLHFSISHSKNVIIACFDDVPCGIDIEYIKKRDIKKLSQYFETDFKTLKDFYKFWTIKEAVYKLNEDNINTNSVILNADYFVSVASTSNCAFDKLSLIYYTDD